jgi:cysteine desulfurase
MIYADNNGSCPLHPKVIEYLSTRLTSGPYANPNSIHSLGRKMNFGLEKCRRVCAKILGAKTSQVSFNSGASEGLSHVFHSVLSDRSDGKNVIITSGLEHAAVVNAAKYYSAKRNFKLEIINSLKDGTIDLEHLSEVLKSNKDKVALVALMAANNETGVIQPYKKIGLLCSAHGAEYLCDTTQFIGKAEFNFEQSNIDYAVVSGHKVGAIIGSGILISKNTENMKPMVFGGEIQEFGIRGGTQNYIGAETLAVAFELFEEKKGEIERVRNLRIQFEKNIKDKFPDVVIIGDTADRLSSTTLISKPGLHGQAVQIELESNEIFVTTSSACSDNEPVTSKVLRSMNVDDAVGRGIVRISLCLGATEEAYGSIETALTNAYEKLSKIKSY